MLTIPGGASRVLPFPHPCSFLLIRSVYSPGRGTFPSCIVSAKHLLQRPTLLSGSAGHLCVRTIWQRTEPAVGYPDHIY